MKNLEGGMSGKNRYRRGKRSLAVTLAVNLCLFALKLTAGLAGASRALVIDAVHTLSDSVSTVVAWSGFRAASRPRDRDHPYGHGKFETMSTAFLSILLLGAGTIYLARGLAGLAGGSAARAPGVVALAAAGLSIVVKESLYQYVSRVGRRLGSTALVADAWHHRSDALSSLPALIGIWAARQGFFFMDSLAAAIVSLFVIRIGFRLGRGAFHELVEGSVEQSLLDILREEALSVAGVRLVREIRARRLGSEIVVEIHLLVDGRLSVSEGHEIAESVERRLREKVPGVSRVTSHLDPVAGRDR